MKGKIAQRHFYDKVPAAVQEAMDLYYAKTGRRYRMVDTYRMDDAEYALVGMGGMMETAQAAADYMRGKWTSKSASFTSPASRRSRPPSLLTRSGTSARSPFSNAWTTRSHNPIRSCKASKPASPTRSPA